MLETVQNENEEDNSNNTLGSVRSGSRATKKPQEDSAHAKLKPQMEQLNNRWNSVRLRVLTLRSKLESSQVYSRASLTRTTTPLPEEMSTSISNNNNHAPTPSTSYYSVNGGPGVSAAAFEEALTASAVAFSAAVSDRSSQLMLSLRELTEWIIKRQTEFEQQQSIQQQQLLQVQHQQQQQNGQQSSALAVSHAIPLDVANVLQRKAALVQLRVTLDDKRPIIDSTLLACHQFLRRLAVKRNQEIYQTRIVSRLASSNSIASSITGASTSSQFNGSSNEHDPTRLASIRQQKATEIAEYELSLSREMQKLLEIWNSLQIDVEMRLQRLDDAHLVSHTSCFYIFHTRQLL